MRPALISRDHTNVADRHPIGSGNGTVCCALPTKFSDHGDIRVCYEGARVINSPKCPMTPAVLRILRSRSPFEIGRLVIVLVAIKMANFMARRRFWPMPECRDNDVDTVLQSAFHIDFSIAVGSDKSWHPPKRIMLRMLPCNAAVDAAIAACLVTWKSRNRTKLKGHNSILAHSKTRRVCAGLSLFALSTAFGGCSLFQSTPVATVKPFCRAVKPTTVSKDDILTEETARGMEADNRALAKLCP
jgi:hypothetical protein